MKTTISMFMIMFMIMVIVMVIVITSFLFRTILITIRMGMGAILFTEKLRLAMAAVADYRILKSC